MVLERDSRESLAALARAIRRRGRLALIVFFAFVIVTIAIALLWPKRYAAEAKIIVGANGAAGSASGSVTTTLPILNALLAQSGVQSTETYAELLEETPVVQSVIDRLHLATTPRALASHLTVKPVTNTAILGVRATWSDPATAAAIANGFANAFIQRERELIARQADAAVAEVTRQIPAAHRRVASASAELATYQTQHGIADIATQTTSAITAAAALDARLNATLVDRNQATAQIANLSEQLRATSAVTTNGGAVQPNPVAAELRQQIAQTDVLLRNARQQYTEEHPTVVNLVAQRANLQRELARTQPTIVSERDSAANPVYQQIAQQLANARAAVASDEAQIALMRAQRAAMAPNLAALPAQAGRLTQLERALKDASDVESALQQKRNEATVARSTAIADATIVQQALSQAAEVSPNVLLVGAIAIVLGLAFAAGTIAVREFFDATVKDAADVERDLGLALIASVPELPDMGKSTTPAERYRVADAFLQLVTALRYSSDRPLRTIAITSPAIGDGKSTIACNIARALGELTTINRDRLPKHVTQASEPRILLVDADLRRPSLHRRLELPNARGLSDVLVGTSTIEAAVQRTTIPGVDVLTSGTPSPNPIKLLDSDRFDALLAELTKRYATVIFDAPSVTAVLDAAVVARKADGTLMVIAAGQTDTRMARNAMARLESVGVTNVLGAILNRTRERTPEYDDYVALAASAMRPLSTSAP